MIPAMLAMALPSIGIAGHRTAREWLSLEFWTPPRESRLGVFWWVGPVTDIGQRDAALDRLLADHATGLRSKSNADWHGRDEFALSGETISKAWWPKGGAPSLAAAERSVLEHLAAWEERVDPMVRALGAEPFCTETSRVRDIAKLKASVPPRIAEPVTGSYSTSEVRSTPAITADFRAFRAQPHYTSIFEIYPEETHIFGTEDWHGNWNATVLFMAKDAGSSQIFMPREKGGRGWAWVTNHARPTNRHLRPLLESLPGEHLYGSFLGPLLRNDNRESGNLYLDDSIRRFVGKLFRWTVSEMGRVQTVAVLGGEAWKEITGALGLAAESRQWKMRHLSGDPLRVSVDGKDIELIALNHPARIGSERLKEQAGWKGILAKHTG